jgi:hypothetical protein
VNAETVRLVSHGEIVGIANSGNNKTDFYVKLVGGSGPCVGAGILFPRASAPSENYHQRAFSLALAAYTTDSKKVNITSFEGSNCTKAALIELEK